MADSKVAIAAVRKAGLGKRDPDTSRRWDEIAERVEGGGMVRVGWVKAHTGIPGNEAAEGVPLDDHVPQQCPLTQGNNLGLLPL